jgi:ferrous iron transport protein A
MNSALSSIKTGQQVSVVSIQDSSLKPKLMEMGFVQGKQLTILFRAPFGDPIAIDMNGYVLSLRLDEAALIDVQEAVTEQRF